METGFFIYFAQTCRTVMQPNLTELLYRHFLDHRVVSTDSRRISPGCLFFTLKGSTFNGNHFVREAFAQGAAYAIVDEQVGVINDRCIRVDDGLAALQDLARHHREQFTIPVIAITGTNGKTTTKELIRTVLSEKFRTVATRGNLNNHIGVPLTLLEIDENTEIAVIEMGASHPGEIGFLCRIAEPGYGLITNIGKAHLEGFGGFEGVIRTKTELYRYLQDTGGKVFINLDDPLLMDLARDITLITYGFHPAFVTAGSLMADPFVRLEMILPGQPPMTVESHLYGRYNAPNILAAACAGYHFGVEPSQIRQAIEAYRPSNNRSQIETTASNLLILDAYNANPASMTEALETFAGTAYPGKVVILGDMLELGDETDTEHQNILEILDQLNLNAVFLIGPFFTRQNRKREHICFNDIDLARIWFEHHPLKGKTILLKGSRGIQLEKLVELL